jgi:hypothetical protein
MKRNNKKRAGSFFEPALFYSVANVLDNLIIPYAESLRIIGHHKLKSLANYHHYQIS